MRTNSEQLAPVPPHRDDAAPTLTVRGGGLTSRAMAVREILVLPDDRLRQISKPVASVTPAVKALVADMFETMYDAPGIGLAAIQIGVAERIVTIDIAKREGEDESAPRVFINPEIVWSSEEKSPYEEGCLSIPEYYEEVERPAKVRVRYMDIDGKQHEEEAEG